MTCGVRINRVDSAVWVSALRAMDCYLWIGSFSGAGDRSRTYDLRITNALLYQLSYTGTGRGW